MERDGLEARDAPPATPVQADPSPPPDSRETLAGYPRNLVLAGLVSFLTDTTTKMVYSILPLFLMSIGASRTTLSIIEGIAESTAALVKTASGFWSDRIGRNKPFLIAGYSVTALATPVMALVASPLQVLLLRFVEKVGKGIRTAPRDSLVAASAARGDSGRSFGLHKAMDNSGAIAGPLLAYVLLAAFPGSFRLLFVVAALPSAAAVATLVLGVREASRPSHALYRRFRFRDFPRRFWLLLGIVFLFTLGNSTDALLLVKAAEVGVDVAHVPLVYLVFNAVSVALAVPIGRRSDSIGRERVLVAGYLVYAAVYLGFGFVTDARFVLVLFALYGVYSAATDGVQKALVSDLLDPARRGTGLGIYNAVLGLTLLPASVIAGILYDRVDARVPFWFGSAMAAGAALLMVAFLRTAPAVRRPAP